MLYDLEFVQGLPDKQGRWKLPAVYYVAKESTCKHALLKKFIEAWFDKLPDPQKSDYYSRLRSQDDKVFIAQVNEFVVAEACMRIGNVQFNPTLQTGKTPELLWELDECIGLLDVVTIFESTEVGQEQDAVDSLLNYLGEIEHFFDVGFWYESVDKHNLKPSSIKKKLVKYLDSLDLSCVKHEEELLIEEEGLVGGFYITPKSDITERSKINFALMGPARKIEPLKAIEKRIKSKIQKYKWDGPIFVAICKAADAGVDWDEVAEILYGPSLISYDRKTGQHMDVLGNGGFLMPQGDRPPLNTSLTGILYCDWDWNEELPILDVKYLVNPFAKFPIALPLPTYPIIEDGRIKFDWLNTGQQHLGHH